VTDSAMRLRKRASEQYQQASTGVGEAVDELTRKGRDARDDVADAVARGAHEVERYATAAKTDSVAWHCRRERVVPRDVQSQENERRVQQLGSD
jgi:hypothetical protein